jgi:predicted kinase
VTGSKLIVIRGNSGSGKTSVAREVRARYGRGCALIEQDYFRRIVLREHDSAASTGIAPELIGTAARLALDRGYHVVLEGILSTVRYSPMIRDLVAAQHGDSHLFYLDVSYDESVRRHATRPLASEVTPAQTPWSDLLRDERLAVSDEISSCQQHNQRSSDRGPLCRIHLRMTAIVPVDGRPNAHRSSTASARACEQQMTASSPGGEFE